ncbi:uncharacterized protein [Ptychodera flava]|uniref:uncharacterized protein n=1 Tax=Ptychodera flava TaxID=63121 RepID=UPI00396A57EB
MPSMVTFETGTNVSIEVMSITVRNNGPDDLSTLSDGRFHYSMGMYIVALEGDKMRDPVQVKSFSLNDDVVLRRSNGIIAGGGQAYQVPDWPTAVINYPAEKCKTHSNLCVAIEHLGNYTDYNSENDFFCLPFVSVFFSESVGPTNCPSDVVPVAVDITAAKSLKYVYDTPTAVTIDIRLHNSGGTVVPGGVENIGFSAFIASHDRADANMKTDLGDVNLNTTNLSDSIGPWSDTKYSNIVIEVTVPGQNCSDFKHLCIVFEKATINATFEDDKSNNFLCLPFSDVTDGGVGVIVCQNNQELPTRSSFVEWWVILAMTIFAFVAVGPVCICLICKFYINLYRKKHKVDIEQQPEKDIEERGVNTKDTEKSKASTAWTI